MVEKDKEASERDAEPGNFGCANVRRLRVGCCGLIPFVRGSVAGFDRCSSVPLIKIWIICRKVCCQVQGILRWRTCELIMPPFVLILHYVKDSVPLILPPPLINPS